MAPSGAAPRSQGRGGGGLGGRGGGAAGPTWAPWHGQRPPPPPSNAVILPGPRKPVWGCMCGTDGNWACRLACRTCGRAAPLATRQRALEQAAGATKGTKEGDGKPAGKRGQQLPQGGQAAPPEPAPRGQQGQESTPGKAGEATVAACLALLATKGVELSEGDRAKLAPPPPPAKEVKPKTYSQVLQNCIWKLEKLDKQAAAKAAAHQEAEHQLELAKEALSQAAAALEAARKRQAEGRAALEQAKRAEAAGLPPGSTTARGAELATALAGLEALAEAAASAEGSEAASLDASRAVLQRKVDAIRAEIAAAEGADKDSPMGEGGEPPAAADPRAAGPGGERRQGPAGAAPNGDDAAQSAFFDKVEQLEGENRRRFEEACVAAGVELPAAKRARGDDSGGQGSTGKGPA